jgi:hypothetical protein
MKNKQQLFKLMFDEETATYQYVPAFEYPPTGTDLTQYYAIFGQSRGLGDLKPARPMTSLIELTKRVLSKLPDDTKISVGYEFDTDVAYIDSITEINAIQAMNLSATQTVDKLVEALDDYDFEYVTFHVPSMNSIFTLVGTDKVVVRYGKSTNVLASILNAGTEIW